MSLRLTLISAAALLTFGTAMAQTTAPAMTPSAATSPVAAPTAPTVENGVVTNTPSTQTKTLVADTKPTLIADGKFRGVLGLGASVASGNSRSSNLALTGQAVRATDLNKTSLYALALRSSADGETTGEQIRLGGRYDHNLTTQLFGFGGLDFERNKFANLKLRSQATAGLGYHFINTPTTTWDLFGGLAYTADKFVSATEIDGSTRSSYAYPSLLLAEESTHVLSDTTTARQRVAVYPNLRNTGEFRATLDAGIAVAMTRALSLNVGLGAAYNSEPGTGRKKTDTLLTTGVSVKFD